MGLLDDRSAAQGHAETIRRAIYANGPQEWDVPIAALDALLAEIERLREALRGIATLRGWAQVVREGGEERFGFRALEESEREPVARGFEHAAYLAEEALKDV